MRFRYFPDIPPGGPASLAWLKGHQFVHALLDPMRQPLQVVVVFVAWALLLSGIFALSYQGLAFVNRVAGLGPFVLDRLWYLFLFLVFLMLLVSQAATAVSTLVRSSETTFWLSLPIEPRWMLRAKYLESSCYSAWAVVFLVVPLGLADVLVLNKPVHRMWWLVAHMLPLIGIATALSTLGLLVWLKTVGRRVVLRREAILAGCAVVALWLFWSLAREGQARQQDVWFVALQELLPRMRLAMAPWMPSAWLARSFSAALDARWTEAWAYAALLWTTALAAARALERVGARWFVPVVREAAEQPTPSVTDAERDLAYATIDLSWWLGRPFVACIVKDIMLFVRDPVQWSQGLVFFGILGAYFSNLDRFAHMAVEPQWKAGVASLNLGCTLLVFGALAVRFIFPQMSLEGRRLWLLHLAPGGFARVLYAKLVFYGALAVVLVEGLSLLSATRLVLPVPVVLWLAGVGLVAAVSLVGMTVGLGAWLIDTTQTDPARIVSSSRGALVLLVMLVYVGIVAWGLTMAWTGLVQHDASRVGVVAAVMLALSLLFGWLPMAQGIRTLERLEL